MKKSDGLPPSSLPEALSYGAASRAGGEQIAPALGHAARAGAAWRGVVIEKRAVRSRSALSADPSPAPPSSPGASKRKRAVGGEGPAPASLPLRGGKSNEECLAYLVKKLGSLRKELSMERSKRREAEGASQRILDKLVDARKKLFDQSDELDMLRAERDEHAARWRMLQAQREAETKMDEMFSAFGSKHVQTLGSELRLVHERAEAVRTECERKEALLRSMLSRSHLQLEELESRSSQLERQLEEKEALASKLTAERDSMTATLQKEVETLHGQLRVTEDTMVEQQQKISDLQRALAEAKESCRVKGDEAKSLRRQVETLQLLAEAAASSGAGSASGAGGEEEGADDAPRTPTRAAARRGVPASPAAAASTASPARAILPHTLSFRLDGDGSSSGSGSAGAGGLMPASSASWTSLPGLASFPADMVARVERELAEERRERREGSGSEGVTHGSSGSSSGGSDVFMFPVDVAGEAGSSSGDSTGSVGLAASFSSTGPRGGDPSTVTSVDSTDSFTSSDEALPASRLSASQRAQLARTKSEALRSQLSAVGPGHPDWMRDDETDDCPICKAAFGLLRRRHHCRVCGTLVCGPCSRSRCTVGTEFVRSCDPCAKLMGPLPQLDEEHVS